MTRFDRMAVAHDYADTGALNPDYWRSEHDIPDHPAGKPCCSSVPFATVAFGSVAQAAAKLVDKVGNDTGPNS